MICKGRTKDGKSCAAKPRPGTDLCPWHSPDLAERRAEWRRRGGVNSSSRARVRKQIADAPLTTNEVQGLLSKALQDLLHNALEPGRANAAAALGKALIVIRESSELEARLTALEKAAGVDRRTA